ncbi:MAG: DUF6773 family protein [Bacteroidota bacterium]
MSFKEIKDERLELQKYKAGYETYNILMIIILVVTMILLYAIDIDTNPIVLITFIPLFAGLWIYEFKAEEAEEFDEEQTVLKAVAQRQKWIVIAKRAAFVAVFGFLSKYFVLDNKSDFWSSLSFALLNGIAIGIFWYFHMNKVLKKSKEQSDV